VLDGLRAKYETKGFKFLGIHSNQDEISEKARAHFVSSPVHFPIISDPGAKLADQFGALKTPHVFVLLPSGAIAYQGGVDDSHTASDAKHHPLADALESVSRGEKPQQDSFRTLGCLISRKP
jgi:peroxiredoxin